MKHEGSKLHLMKQGVWLNCEWSVQYWEWGKLACQLDSLEPVMRGQSKDDKKSKSQMSKLLYCFLCKCLVYIIPYREGVSIFIWILFAENYEEGSDELSAFKPL